MLKDDLRICPAIRLLKILHVASGDYSQLDKFVSYPLFHKRLIDKRQIRLSQRTSGHDTPLQLTVIYFRFRRNMNIYLNDMYVHLAALFPLRVMLCILLAFARAQFQMYNVYSPHSTAFLTYIFRYN